MKYITGVLPGGSGTTIGHNTQHYTKYHSTLKQNTAHKATQTIQDTLHTMNTTGKNKAILATGRGGLWDCKMTSASETVQHQAIARE
jgi:hypothetical protein